MPSPVDKGVKNTWHEDENWKLRIRQEMSSYKQYDEKWGTGNALQNLTNNTLSPPRARKGSGVLAKYYAGGTWSLREKVSHDPDGKRTCDESPKKTVSLDDQLGAELYKTTNRGSFADPSKANLEIVVRRG
eukprot:jgi/Mesvir1/19333/Mv10391-RA.1